MNIVKNLRIMPSLTTREAWMLDMIGSNSTTDGCVRMGNEYSDCATIPVDGILFIELITLLRDDKKIPAVKKLREAAKTDLKHAKGAIDWLQILIGMRTRRWCESCDCSCSAEGNYCNRCGDQHSPF